MNLPLDTEYKIIGHDCLVDNYTSCENCSRVICNIATIEDTEGHKYSVGLDCAETLSGIHALDIRETKRLISRTRKLIKFIKKEAQTAFIRENTVWLYKYEINEWQSTWIYRLDINKYKLYRDINPFIKTIYASK